MSDQKKPLGRPSLYSPELALRICARLAEGETLRSICRDDSTPARSTIFAWIACNPEFSGQYTHAREVGYYEMADEMLEIADDTSCDTITDEESERANHEWITRSRLRVDTRKWLLSKSLPKVYGDKVSAELTGKDGAPLVTDPRELAREVAFLLASGVQALGEGQG